MRTRLVLSILAISIAPVALAAWYSTYPSPDDPKSIQYVMWKAGIWEMDLDRAAGTMIGDRHRDALVVGKTREELRRRFDRLLPLAEASPYLRGCYEGSAWRGRDVLFIRSSSCEPPKAAPASERRP